MPSTLARASGTARWNNENLLMLPAYQRVRKAASPYSQRCGSRAFSSTLLRPRGRGRERSVRGCLRHRGRTPVIASTRCDGGTIAGFAAWLTHWRNAVVERARQGDALAWYVDV